MQNLLICGANQLHTKTVLGMPMAHIAKAKMDENLSRSMVSPPISKAKMLGSMRSMPLTSLKMGQDWHKQGQH